MRTYKLIKIDYSRYRKDNPNLFKILKLSISRGNFRAIFLFRIANSLKRKKLNFISSLLIKLMNHFSHCYINVNASIGEGFLISHVGGIIIGGKTKIGKFCDIRQNVTFGGNFNRKDNQGNSQPILSDYVSVGAGACILGPVKIGSHSIIGANSVVTRDVDESVIVSGIPAVEIKKVWSDGERKL